MRCGPARPAGRRGFDDGHQRSFAVLLPPAPAGAGGSIGGDQLSLRVVFIWSSAHLAPSATDFLPVRMSVSIVCRMLPFSTSAHFSALGVNQLSLAASAAGAMVGLSAAALSISAVEFGSAF